MTTMRAKSLLPSWAGRLICAVFELTPLPEQISASLIPTRHVNQVRRSRGLETRDLARMINVVYGQIHRRYQAKETSGI